MIPLESFLPEVLIHAPACPDPTARNSLINAARTFCERTRLWRDWDRFNITPDACNVACAPVGAELFEVDEALLNQRSLQPVTLAELRAINPNWREEQGQGNYFVLDGTGGVTITPRGTGSLTLIMILRPSLDAEFLPEVLGQYRKLIAAGALSELLMIPGQPFSAPDRAQYFQAMFKEGLESLFTRNVQGQQRAPLRTRPHYF